MSAIEAAGIVLATIPLVISALEHYAEGIRTIQRWRLYEREIRSLKRNLNTEFVKLQNVCEILLDGIVPYSQIETMIQQPLNESWKDQSVVTNLRFRLRRSFTIFQETVQDMMDAIEEIKIKLDLAPDGKVKWAEASSIIREFKRATFTIKKADYQALLTTIRDANNNLDTLISKEMEREPKRRGQYSDLWFSIARKISIGVYDALRSSIVCCCSESHSAHLELASQSINISPYDDECKIRNATYRRIALSNSINPGQEDTRAWYWDEIIVQPVDIQYEQQLTVYSSLNAKTSRKMSKMKVSFASNSTSIPAEGRGAVASVQPYLGLCGSLEIEMANLASKQVSQGLSQDGFLPKLVDLCQTIRRAQKWSMKESYGYLTDPSLPTYEKYWVYPVGMCADSANWRAVTLQDVLKSKKSMIQPLTFIEKLQLSVAISSSILQLHGTPWLPGILTSKDIFFIQRDNIPLYQHAFIAKRPTELKKHDSPVDTTNNLLSIWNPTLFALRSLGIVLIEVVRGETFNVLQNLDSSQDRANIYEMLADEAQIHRFLGEVSQFVGNIYHSVVKRCLYADFSCLNPSFEDDNFRRIIYQGVVAPLELELKNACMEF